MLKIDAISSSSSDSALLDRLDEKIHIFVDPSAFLLQFIRPISNCANITIYINSTSLDSDSKDSASSRNPSESKSHSPEAKLSATE